MENGMTCCGMRWKTDRECANGRGMRCGGATLRKSPYRLFLLRAALSSDVEVHLRAEAHFSRSSSR